MTSETVRGSLSAPLDRPATSPVVRWLLWLFFIALGLLLLAVFAAAIFAFRWWAEDRVAAKAVEDEVARLRLAGQPMTVEDQYADHRAPPGMHDTTPAWQTALTAVSGKETRDAKGIPYVGDGDPALLRPGAESSQLALAEQFLAERDSALEAAFSAAREEGECRYPVAFEMVSSRMPPEVHSMRTLTRLLALDVHVKAVRGKTDSALQSLLTMFAAADTLSHQPTLAEQLVRLATLGSALGQTELLMNEVELSDDQLSHLAHRIDACDLQGSFTRSLIGERAMGYQAFAFIYPGTLPRWVDCRKYLEAMSQAITFSSQPLPAGRNHMQALVAQFTAQWSKNKHVLTANALPALTKSFDAYAVAIAYREALLTAIAAERYRLKMGHLPSQLADLTPDYLPAAPLDPFDDQPLRLRVSDGDIRIYSVGLNGKDDKASNPLGNSREPDIVVRLSSIRKSP